METGTILPITRSIVSIYQNCVTVNMRALPFMRAHRGILVLQVAAILKRGAGVYAKGGERRERELRPKRTFGRGCEMKESRGGWGGVSRRKRSRRKSRVWSSGGREIWRKTRVEET